MPAGVVLLLTAPEEEDEDVGLTFGPEDEEAVAGFPRSLTLDASLRTILTDSLFIGSDFENSLIGLILSNSSALASLLARSFDFELVSWEVLVILMDVIWKKS